MATHNVVVPKLMEQLIDDLVNTGRYQNFSEVVRAGIRMLLEHEAAESARLEALRNATSVAMMQVESGHYEEVDPANLAAYFHNLGRTAGKQA
ncbi:type II toxin-antitoxin system ParD family antitoxin [Pseudomonas asiatica]|uniref:Antitoxin ParD n=1 Tax=Pseudomonas asiatica TaxID=2219225 RepID=A0ABU5KVS7_9PSED|nr:type II toxin-antitoxin system ParD family antitoxin [Pseudomonas asiatica]MDZ5738033.1 type II toxin-antitoxin system ParD family antitoxin [Pseudomonas asiatica]MDZ5744629.1 type II toxin-antitoxin system ParD family antitoxin [Pseudomonas asiatica]MDZ5748789.1 type II toxin-antitoxin system ParD family antitoxin [Pseudomonas asiatica]MDZ5753121.1 type II toxin-antitoxin system ParD family antitoxin [Pseudomonas asiatica]